MTVTPAALWWKLRPHLIERIDRLRGHRDPTPAWVTLSVGGLAQSEATALAATLGGDLYRQQLRGPSAVSTRFEAQFGHADPIRRSSLEDVDVECVEALREAGGKWGPLGVALVAAHLTDPDVLVARLRENYRPGYRDTLRPPLLEEAQHRLLGHFPRWGGEDGDGPLEGCTCGHMLAWGGPGYAEHLARVAFDLEGRPGVTAEQGEDLDRDLYGTGLPEDVHVIRATPETIAQIRPANRPNYVDVAAGSATEFLGRLVVLPDRPWLPQGEHVLEEATPGILEGTEDDDIPSECVYVRLRGHEQPYALLHGWRLLVGPAA